MGFSKYNSNTGAGDLDSGLIDVDPEYQREVVWTGKSVRNKLRLDRT